jgi:subtilisin family serine protease
MAEYITNGIRREVVLEPVPRTIERAAARRTGAPAAALGYRMTRLVGGLRAAKALAARFVEVDEKLMFLVQPAKGVAAAPRTLIVATAAVVVEGARRSDIQWATDKFGASIVEEGHEGKILLRVPGDSEQSVTRAFDLALELHARGVGLAHPNFVRALPRVRLAEAQANPHWPREMLGMAAAWKTTKGKAEIRVAVLDEGVDTSHPALAPAVVLQQDFIGDKGASAMPDNDDAHGTACAGIIVSRDATWPGVAPGVSLIAARIAMGDGYDQWIFDDFKTADAIDWCWRNGAAVLSNSWGGGPPVDVITRAFERARTLGRNGLGAVVAVAAGNAQTAVHYPATLQGVVAVGASNEFDERKTRTSRDGETWWGSNYGRELALLAPGVHVGTTDIVGAHGYDPGDFTMTFNGTSAATPHVAAAAALALSVAPNLTEVQVRQILVDTAHKLKGQTGWTPDLGHGRLDVAAVVTTAKSPPQSPTIVGSVAPPKRPLFAPAKRAASRQGKRTPSHSATRKPSWPKKRRPRS